MRPVELHPARHAFAGAEHALRGSLAIFPADRAVAGLLRVVAVAGASHAVSVCAGREREQGQRAARRESARGAAHGMAPRINARALSRLWPTRLRTADCATPPLNAGM